MNYFYIILASLICQSSFAGKKPWDLDLDIAKYAAILGTNRLYKDKQDKKGKLLMKLAANLNDEDKYYAYTRDRMDAGLEIKPIKTKVTEKQFLNVLKKRAAQLLAHEKLAVRFLALIYYKVYEQFDAKDEDAMIALARLKRQGLEGELDEIIAAKTDLSLLFGKKGITAPEEVKEVKYEPPKGTEADWNVSFRTDLSKLNLYFTSQDITRGDIYLNRAKYYCLRLGQYGSLTSRKKFVGDFEVTLNGVVRQMSFSWGGHELKFLTGNSKKGNYIFQREGRKLYVRSSATKVLMEKDISPTDDKTSSEIVIKSEDYENNYIVKLKVKGETSD